MYSFDGLNSKQRSREVYAIANNLTAEAESFLLKEFIVERNLNGIAYGFIKVSWIIAMVILDNGSEDSVLCVRELMAEYWSNIEKEDFKSYVSKTPSIYNKL